MKPKQPLTEEAKYEQRLLMEKDLGHLVRQYKIMERDRKAVQGASSGKLGKQRKVIKILKNEQKNILTDLNVATSPAKLAQDQALASNLTHLLEEYDEFGDQIKSEKAHLQEVKDQIRQVQKHITQLAPKQITDIQAQERILTGTKTVEALENKLDVQIKKFCTILSQNRKLREEIDHLLKERAHFNILWERLISNLNQGKKFMLDLIEQATIAYDQREEWCSKLQVLRTRAYSELVLHGEEIRELNRKIDHDVKLQDFLNVKCQKRVMAALEAKELKKRQKLREDTQMKLEQYNEMLTQIYDFTGNSQVQDIAAHFEKQEVENFAMFKYINELNKGLEGLSDEIGHLHMEIDDQRALNEQRAEQQQEKLKSLEEELELATQEADQTEEELQVTEAKLSTLLKGIDKLFKLCKCSNAPLLELLGDNTEINNYNVLLHLEILEKRVSELILKVYYREKIAADKKKGKYQGLIKSEGPAKVTHPIDNIVSTQPCPLCVQHEQVSDVIDVLQFALDREEIQYKLNRRLQLPDGLDRLHNVSACHLPESRQIIQRRYQ